MNVVGYKDGCCENDRAREMGFYMNVVGYKV